MFGPGLVFSLSRKFGTQDRFRYHIPDTSSIQGSPRYHGSFGDRRHRSLASPPVACEQWKRLKKHDLIGISKLCKIHLAFNGMNWPGIIDMIRYAHDAIFISFCLPEVRTAYSFRCFFSCWFCLWPNLSLQMPFCSCFIHKPGHQALHCKMQWYREAIFLSCQALPRLIRADTFCPLCIILPRISSPSRITSQFFSRPWNLQMIPAWKIV